MDSKQRAFILPPLSTERALVLPGNCPQLSACISDGSQRHMFQLSNFCVSDFSEDKNTLRRTQDNFRQGHFWKWHRRTMWHFISHRYLPSSEFLPQRLFPLWAVGIPARGRARPPVVSVGSGSHYLLAIWVLWVVCFDVFWFLGNAMGVCSAVFGRVSLTVLPNHYKHKVTEQHVCYHPHLGNVPCYRNGRGRRSLHASKQLLLRSDNEKQRSLESAQCVVVRMTTKGIQFGMAEVWKDPQRPPRLSYFPSMDSEAWKKDGVCDSFAWTWRIFSFAFVLTRSDCVSEFHWHERPYFSCPVLI